MAHVYILYSNTINRFYIGSCLDLNERIEDHLKCKYKSAYTAQVTDWQLFLSIDNLEYEVARKIELHIKKMKSRQYIENLKKYPSIIEKLLEL